MGVRGGEGKMQEGRVSGGYHSILGSVYFNPRSEAFCSLCCVRVCGVRMCDKMYIGQ